MAGKKRGRSNVLQMLGSWILQIGLSKHRSRKKEGKKGRDSVYGQATKGAAREEAENVWYNLCQKVQDQRDGEARRGEMTRVQYIECGRRDAIKGRVSEQERKKILCPECRIGNKKPQWNWRVATYPIEGKAQQSNMQAKTPKSAAKTKDRQRGIRRMFKILKEVWLSIGVEKIDIYERVTMKALLDNGTTGIFIDKKMAAKHRFKLQKLDRPVMVRNVNGTNNSGEAITHQVEVNIYYKSHVKRMRMDIYDLRRINIILGMPWLQAHNPEINQETEEVKMIRYLPICRRKIAVKEKIEKKKNIGKRIKVADQIDKEKQKQTMEEKFNDEVELDRKKVGKMVLQKFHRWLKVFKKAESKRMPVRKPWDHAMNLREDFMPRKGKMYLMSREKKEKVREFVEEQLRKGYI